MDPALSIKIDYPLERPNPSSVFFAMALYIEAYASLNQLLMEAVGVENEYKFKLDEIKTGSILSKISAIPGIIDSYFESAFYHAGNNLMEEISQTNSTETEDDVEELAQKLQSDLEEMLPTNFGGALVDRKKLTYVLHGISLATNKLSDKDLVEFSSSSEPNYKVKFNTEWRFNGNYNEMFNGKVLTQKIKDILYVPVIVNEGKKAWNFKSTQLKTKFNATFLDKEWLEKYQNGIIPAIGPNDEIEVELEYSYYVTSDRSSPLKISNAKIIKVIDIRRNTRQQYEENV